MTTHHKKYNTSLLETIVFHGSIGEERGKIALHRNASGKDEGYTTRESSIIASLHG
jgi:hypothetical protein